MPAANFTRFFAEIQRLFEAGDVAGAEALFQSELPYVLWAMQSIDFSVRATKTELLGPVRIPTQEPCASRGSTSIKSRRTSSRGSLRAAGKYVIPPMAAARA